MRDELMIEAASAPSGAAQSGKRLPGHNREIVALNIREARTFNFLRELERRGFRITKFETKDWTATIVKLWPFAKALRRSRTLLCGAVQPFQLPWILLARLLGCTCVMDFPMDITVWPFVSRRHWIWLVTLTLRLASGVLTLRSREYMIEKFGLRRQRVGFVENCPEPDLVSTCSHGRPRFEPRPDSFLICWSGGHLHHRLERFMPTFECLLELLPNAELLLIADPAQASIAESKQYAERAGLTDRVHISPVILPTPDFYATVAQCQLWIATLGDDTLQGRQELRMELLEMGLLGVAVVSSPTPALLQHGFTHAREIIYIDPSDPKGSALTIAEFARQPELLKQLAGQLRAHVQTNFSLEKAVDDMLEILRP